MKIMTRVKSQKQNRKNITEEIKQLLSFFREYFPYTLNLRKMSNYRKAEQEYRNNKIFLKSRPYYYFVDIGNICNLRCPLCPTGTHSDKRKRKFMNFPTYQRVLNKIKPYAVEVRLFNWGEPFLNKDLFKIIGFTKKNKIYVTLSSNFNIITDKMIYNIVKYKTDKIVISLDGATQKSYSAYRRGGNFHKVLNNIRKLVSYKKKYRSKNPKIVWQFLINKKNIKDLKKAKKLAKQLGVELCLGKLTLNQQIIRKNEKIDRNLVKEWIPKKLQKDIRNYRFIAARPCKFLYDTMVINPEGTVSPCCALFDSTTDFGEILNSNLENIWNNKKFVSAREIFQGDKKIAVKTVCHECNSIVQSNL